MIELYCQHCGHHLKIPDKYAGQSGKCKNCGKQIVVPSVGFEPDPTPAPTGKAKDIPYKLIGATAGIMAILALGAYTFFQKDSESPSQSKNVASTSPAVETRTIAPQDSPTSNIAENLSPPSPNFPDFTEGKAYVSRAVDTDSAFTLKPEDISFELGVRREFVQGLGQLREKSGFSVAWETMDTFDSHGDTFYTVRQIPGENTSGGHEVFSVMRNDGLYVYHHSDDEAPRYFIKFPLTPGMRWSHAIYQFRKGQGPSEREIVTQHYYADTEETIKTPAGTFKCVRVLMGPDPELSDGPDVITFWYAKGFGSFVQVRIPDGQVYIMKAVTSP